MDVRMEIVEWLGRPSPKFPDEYAEVGSLLSGDIMGGDGRVWLEAIDAVLTGAAEEMSGNGNSCSLEIHRDFTHITNMFTGEECVVPTQRLRELIVEWVEVNRKWHKR